MQFIVQFYRLRKCDGARATLGRIGCEANGARDAIDMARRLRRTMEMPQRPDKFSIHDVHGTELFRGAAD